MDLLAHFVGAQLRATQAVAAVCCGVAGVVWFSQAFGQPGVHFADAVFLRR
jgi:hypothetical protein